MRSDISEMEVNKQFNNARAELNKNSTAFYKRIPKFTAEPAQPKVFVAIPVVASDKYTNAIYITERGIEL